VLAAPPPEANRSAAEPGLDAAGRVGAAADPIGQATVKPLGRGFRYWLRQVVPLVIAAVVIAAILRKYPPSDIARQIRLGEPLAVIPYAAVLMLVNILLISYSDALVIRGCLGAPSFREIIRAKAGVTMLNLIGYAASHGGYGVWIARKTGASAKLASGIILYIVMSELFAVCFVVTLSMTGASETTSPTFRLVTFAIPVVFLLLVLLRRSKISGAEIDRGIFAPWRILSRKRGLAHLFLRSLQIAWITLCTWGAANAFGMPIPLFAMATFFPLILVVGSLPVNVAGFGAVQGAWLLLSPWAPGEQLLAFAVLWQLFCAAAIFLRGLPFVRAVVAEIDEGAALKAGASTPS
jgi:hypothetical protein